MSDSLYLCNIKSLERLQSCLVHSLWVICLLSISSLTTIYFLLASLRVHQDFLASGMRHRESLSSMSGCWLPSWRTATRRLGRIRSGRFACNLCCAWLGTKSVQCTDMNRENRHRSYSWRTRPLSNKTPLLHTAWYSSQDTLSVCDSLVN